jgi:AhpD family alkylhydroperoxidase
MRKGQAMSYAKAVRDELRVPTRELRQAIPQVYAGYKELHDSALAAGVLDARTKELIALAIAVSKECDGCIAAHAHAAVQHGATPQEAAEAIGVTFLMNGGPATVYGARAFAAFREFYDPADRRRPAVRPGSAGSTRARDRPAQRPPARGLSGDAAPARVRHRQQDRMTGQ